MVIADALKSNYAVQAVKNPQSFLQDVQRKFKLEEFKAIILKKVVDNTSSENLQKVLNTDELVDKISEYLGVAELVSLNIIYLKDTVIPSPENLPLPVFQLKGNQDTNYEIGNSVFHRAADTHYALTDSTESNNEGSSTQNVLDLNINNVAHVAMTVMSVACQFQKDTINYSMLPFQLIGYIGSNKMINSVMDHLKLTNLVSLKSTSQVIPLLKHMYNTAVDCDFIFKGARPEVNNTESQAISDENELGADNMNNNDASSGIPLNEL